MFMEEFREVFAGIYDPLANDQEACDDAREWILANIDRIAATNPTFDVRSFVDYIDSITEESPNRAMINYYALAFGAYSRACATVALERLLTRSEPSSEC